MSFLLWEADGLFVEFVALGGEDLAADEIDAGDEFGDGVFDLDARVDFDEVEFAGFGIDEEFDRAGVVIAGFAREFECGFGQSVAYVLWEIDGWRYFYYFLVAALDGAVALVEMNQVAVVVAQEFATSMCLARPM